MQVHWLTTFDKIFEFEQQLAKYTGAAYAVMTDCCTHAIELCLRFDKIKQCEFTAYTYLSIPMTMHKLGIEYQYIDQSWIGEYQFINTRIWDCARRLESNMYRPNTLMCLSFQYKKHLNLGRGGMILTDDYKSAQLLKKMSYDGRLPNIPWREQDIEMQGFHYYMTPETAQIGLSKLPNAIATEPVKWTINDWPDLTQMKVFKDK